VTHKKWWFVGPNIPVRFAVLIFAGLAYWLGEGHRTAILIAFLIVYGLAGFGDGLVGVPWLDLLGSSLDDKRRAQLFGWGNAATGLLMLGVVPLIRYILDSDLDFPSNYALLFALAGVLFVITIPLVIFVKEQPGGKAKADIPSLRDYLPELRHVLRQDKPFRAMITARILSDLATLASPFYIGFATEELHMSSSVAVSNSLLTGTAGTVIGALVLARYGDRYVVEFIRVMLLMMVLHPILALISGIVGPAPLYVGFFLFGFASGNLMFSYFNWIISYTTPDQRPIYTGLFNSVAALALLVAPFVGGAIVEVLGYRTVFAVALVVLLGAFYIAMRYLQPVKKETSPAPTT
jgi:MFS family permease